MMTATRMAKSNSFIFSFSFSLFCCHCMTTMWKFHVLWRTLTQDNDFFLFMNYIRNIIQLLKILPTFVKCWKRVGIRAMKFKKERTIHFWVTFSLPLPLSCCLSSLNLQIPKAITLKVKVWEVFKQSSCWSIYFMPTNSCGTFLRLKWGLTCQTWVNFHKKNIMCWPFLLCLISWLLFNTTSCIISLIPCHSIFVHYKVYEVHSVL